VAGRSPPESEMAGGTDFAAANLDEAEDAILDARVARMDAGGAVVRTSCPFNERRRDRLGGITSFIPPQEINHEYRRK
jgi:hypothetical protein